jgi:hypothetical protein
MERLIVHPDNKEQLAALKTFMKAFKIAFEVEKSPYNPEFVAKIQESREQVKRGEVRVVNLAEIEKSSYDPKFVEMIRKGHKDLKTGKGIKVDIDNLWK